jgi:hypothetical protein
MVSSRATISTDARENLARENIFKIIVGVTRWGMGAVKESLLSWVERPGDFYKGGFLSVWKQKLVGHLHR